MSIAVRMEFSCNIFGSFDLILSSHANRFSLLRALMFGITNAFDQS